MKNQDSKPYVNILLAILTLFAFIAILSVERDLFGIRIYHGIIGLSKMVFFVMCLYWGGCIINFIIKKVRR